jgi:hypothetical protein
VNNMPLQITFSPNEIEEYIRIEQGVEATTVETLKARALSEAENFLNHDFSSKTVTWDGVVIVTPVEAPILVKGWVLDRISTLYDNRGAAPQPDYKSLKPLRVAPMRVVDGLRGL